MSNVASTTVTHQSLANKIRLALVDQSDKCPTSQGQGCREVRLHLPVNPINQTLCEIYASEVLREQELDEAEQELMLRLANADTEFRISSSQTGFSNGYVPVEIRDPLFEQTPNPYISAMNSDEEILVTAVPSFKSGELYKLFIMGLVSRAA